MGRAWIGIAALTLAGCADGGEDGGFLRNVLVGRDEVPGTATPAPVVDQVVTLTASPTPGGVIVSSVGLPPTQGWWDAELVRVPSADPSVYAMEFRVRPPLGQPPQGTAPSREILGGTFLGRDELAGISRIAVLGRSNGRSVARQ